MRSPQQGHHGIIGVAVDDIAGGGDAVWEQAITKLKSVSLSDTGKWERRNSAIEKSRKQLRSMRVKLPANIKSLDFVPLGKLRKEHSGDANEVEKMP